MAYDVVGIVRTGESVPTDGRHISQLDHFAHGGSSASHTDLHFCQRFSFAIQVYIYISTVITPDSFQLQ